MQQDPAGGLVDVLAGGDQADSVGVEALVQGDVVGAVAGEPVELVHDDVVDPLAFLVEVAQHLLQCRAAGRGAGGAAFDELLDDLRAHGGGLLLVRLSLGGDREAFFAAAAFGLFAGGDPQVGHGTLDRELRGQRGQRVDGGARWCGGGCCEGHVSIHALFSRRVQCEIALTSTFIHRCSTVVEVIGRRHG
ncbi:hypothetical protein J5O08_00745 [Cellulomonas sp. PS-H5]|nr:hypothetical protein [Cellulomonas sp. PS-H5]MBW0252581.1 hypothetical protein [Cellulomonas sp. PS-H5]